MSQEIPAPLATADGSETETGHGGGNFAILALGSIGVVFGDIGTSPLYALQTALGQFKNGGMGALEVIGYGFADRLGAADRRHRQICVVPHAGRQQGRRRHPLAQRARAHGSRARNRPSCSCWASAGAALFSGDAIITPAISVLSALEGLKQVESRGSRPSSLPATLVILIMLFFVQSRGTAGVAAFFGPIMLVFFAVNTVLGFIQIPQAPAIILEALEPGCRA